MARWMPNMCSLGRITQRASGCAAQSVSTHLLAARAGRPFWGGRALVACEAARGNGVVRYRCGRRRAAGAGGGEGWGGCVAAAAAGGASVAGGALQVCGDIGSPETMIAPPVRAWELGARESRHNRHILGNAVL